MISIRTPPHKGLTRYCLLLRTSDKRHFMHVNTLEEVKGFGSGSMGIGVVARALPYYGFEL